MNIKRTMTIFGHCYNVLKINTIIRFAHCIRFREMLTLNIVGPPVFRHIILCGHITRQSVETFLRDFLHKDRSNTQVNAVIMGK